MTKPWKFLGMLALIASLLVPLMNVQAAGTPVIACDAPGKSGEAGTIIAYTCTITNTGPDADNFQAQLGAPAPAWNTWIDPGSAIPLEKDATAQVTVSVAIPADAALGASDTATISVSAAGGAAATTSINTRFVPPPATATPTPTLAPTNTVPAPVARPLVVVSSYDFGTGSISANDSFTLRAKVTNTGSSAAANIIITFSSSSALPRDTGGVISIASLAPGASVDISQPFQATGDLVGNASTIQASVGYTDPFGAEFSGTFTLTFSVHTHPTTTPTPVYSGPWATATPTGVMKAQIVVSGYTADVDPLQPGTTFNLNLEMHNLGNTDAKGVTLVLGGASGGAADPTSEPGGSGLQGGSSDLSKFAPLGSSNLYYLGDIPAGGMQQTSMKLIVNVDTQPGAYQLKLSFVYADKQNSRRVDDQVITLLVYGMPRAQISFYRAPGPLMAGQPNQLPLQVTNIGRKSTVLGMMTVTAAGAEIQNGSATIGVLDAGSAFPMDAMVIPAAPGKLDLTITISYTDDFNEMREIQQHLSVDVQEAPKMEPGLNPDGTGIQGMGMPAAPQPETFLQKALRFVKGMLGLGSGQPEQAQPGNPLPGNGLPGLTPGPGAEPAAAGGAG